MRRAKCVGQGWLVALLVAGGVGLRIDAAAQEVIVKAGVGSSTFGFDGQEARESAPVRRTGLAAGVGLLQGGDRGGRQIEVLVVQKGAGNVLRRGDRLEFTYIEVPLLLHMDFFKASRQRSAFFSVGPSIAVNLRASYTDDGVREGIRDDIRRFDFGLNAGLGVEVGRLIVEGRANWGMRSAFHAEDTDYKHRTLSLTAGLRFW